MPFHWLAMFIVSPSSPNVNHCKYDHTEAQGSAINAKDISFFFNLISFPVILLGNVLFMQFHPFDHYFLMQLV
jgi:hypothetical protein